MLVAGFAHVMRSHLQFKAVLDNAVIRFEMQKSSLKLNNIFVTVLRGTDCLEPCRSLDLEYFGGVLAANNWKIASAVLQRVPKTCSSSVQSVLKKKLYRYPGGNYRFVHSVFWEKRVTRIPFKQAVQIALRRDEHVFVGRLGLVVVGGGGAL